MTKFKRGDTCYKSNNKTLLTFLCLSSDGNKAVMELHTGEVCVENIANIHLMPTENEKLINDLMAIHSVIGRGVAEVVINAGYRKIKPFRYDVEYSFRNADLVIGNDVIPMPSEAMRDAILKKLKE